MRPLHFLFGLPLLVLTVPAESTASPQSGDATSDALALEQFQRLLEQYQDWTYEDLRQQLQLARPNLSDLSFHPRDAAHYDAIRRGLKMTDEELAKYHSTGLVSVDVGQRHSFSSAYYQIYVSDLPVLVTSDSVLHAWRRSYSALLMELEEHVLRPALSELLKQCHETLASRAGGAPDITHKDVDLYLTVARNLLVGAGSSRWSANGRLRVPSALRIDDEVRARLNDIKLLKLQTQYPTTECTRIYGGERYVDYSQFRPRGNYTRSTALSGYFRCMMWMGRADCGFHILSVDINDGVRVDWQRELRDAALLSELIRESGNQPRLQAITCVLDLLVGESDNISVPEMLALLESERIADTRNLAEDATLERFAESVHSTGLARQMIRSQALVSDPYETFSVAAPRSFQMFGQAFTVDSFVLSQVVFDSIVFGQREQGRMLPSGLDVAAALGNDHAVRQLEVELRKWNYSANLMASRDYVAQLSSRFWDANVHHRWVDTLRSLDDSPDAEHFPQVMRGSAWEAKQLQTQLASWAELRHDHVLYAKQSYSTGAGCLYPDGYVEPYPELYRKLGTLSQTTAERLANLKVLVKEPRFEKRLLQIRDRQIGFLYRFDEIMQELEAIARQELAAQPMSDAQRRFIEATIDRRGSMYYGSGTRPRYDGWYCQLLYNEFQPEKSWDPVVVDVHTNPMKHEALHVGVGNVHFAVVAIDNQDDVAAFVGPVYSYYEFVRPAEERLNDYRWQTMVSEGELPQRPSWTDAFTAKRTVRNFDRLSVNSSGKQFVVKEAKDGRHSKMFEASKTDAGLVELLRILDQHGGDVRFGLELGDVSASGLSALVDVPQLAWVRPGTNIPESSVDDFRRRRPDVEVLPLPTAFAAIKLCTKIDGLRRFDEDKYGTLSPGQVLWLYAEPQIPPRGSLGLGVKLQVKTALQDASGVTIAEQELAPIRRMGLPGDLFHVAAKISIPMTLEPGAYNLRVELKDLLVAPPHSTVVEFKLRSGD